MAGISDIFKSNPEDTFYDRFYKQAVRFEIIGGVFMGASILVNLIMGHSPLAAHIFLTLPGALLLIFGGSSSRPHNIIRSFAQLLSREPSREAAEALLTALTKQRKIGLVNRTIQSVYTAISIYSDQPDADQELLNKLKEAADQRITKRIL